MWVKLVNISKPWEIIHDKFSGTVITENYKNKFSEMPIWKKMKKKISVQTEHEQCGYKPMMFKILKTNKGRDLSSKF